MDFKVLTSGKSVIYSEAAKNLVHISSMKESISSHDDLEHLFKTGSSHTTMLSHVANSERLLR